MIGRIQVSASKGRPLTQGTWIEMLVAVLSVVAVIGRPLTQGTWIEINLLLNISFGGVSRPLTQGTWIEMLCLVVQPLRLCVVPSRRGRGLKSAAWKEKMQMQRSSPHAGDVD